MSIVSAHRQILTYRSDSRDNREIVGRQALERRAVLISFIAHASAPAHKAKLRNFILK